VDRYVADLVLVVLLGLMGGLWFAAASEARGPVVAVVGVVVPIVGVIVAGFGSAFEIEVEQFGVWHEAEARAVILGARQEEVRYPWDWSHLERESSGSR
jgi:drug/metabolite transporter (DMT)-like permease